MNSTKNRHANVPSPGGGKASATVPGDDLSRRVALFLATAAMPGLRRLRVDMVGDTVVLSGRVRTFYERQTAVEWSRRVAGVIDVADQIEVGD